MCAVCFTKGPSKHPVNMLTVFNQAPPQQDIIFIQRLWAHMMTEPTQTGTHTLQEELTGV